MRDAPARPLTHPLSGADPATLLAVLRRNGMVSARHLPQLAMVAGSVLGRAPFSLMERFYVRRKLARAPRPAPPIFLVGHWRSGTTHLYNILSKSPDLGYVPPVATGVPWDMLLLARWLRPLFHRMLPEQRYIDRIPVNPDSPQEDEAALANMQPVSFFHGLYFPRHLRENFLQGVFFDGCSPRDIERWQQRFRYFMDKLALQQPGRRLVIKNPVYTARVAMLRQMYPQAKFIHIHRNPYIVFQSMRNFYDKLLAVYGLQEVDEAPIQQLILEAYPRMMDALTRDTADLPSDQFIEVRYDELDAAPMPVLERIYRQLDLEGFESCRPVFQAYLESVAGFRKNRHAMEPEVVERVESRWRPFIERWGYERPAVA